MTYYEHRPHPFYEVVPVAAQCAGVKTPNAREIALYEGIDREIARIQLGVEIGSLRFRDAVNSGAQQPTS